MKIDIIAVGRCKDNAYLSLLDKYVKRMHWKLKIIEIDAGKRSSTEKQEELILKHIEKNAGTIVALDERGKSISSEELAKKFPLWQENSAGKITFLIGGADGFSEKIRKRANFLLSFGKQTLPHMLVRVMLVEQVYRVQQILAGHPYHRS